MSPYTRVVIDTNVLLSAALLPESVPAKLVDLLLQHGKLVFSPLTFHELETRIWKPKFDRYISIETRQRLLHDFSAAAHWVEISGALSKRAFCRDPDDDHFIHAALAAEVSRLVSGDNDLLVLGAIEKLQIVTPRTALDECRNHC